MGTVVFSKSYSNRRKCLLGANFSCECGELSIYSSTMVHVKSAENKL